MTQSNQPVPQWCVDAAEEWVYGGDKNRTEFRDIVVRKLAAIIARHAPQQPQETYTPTKPGELDRLLSEAHEAAKQPPFPVFSMSDVFGTTTFHQHHKGRYGSGETPRLGDVVRAIEGIDRITTGDVLVIDRLVRGADDTCRWVGLKEHEGLDYFPSRFALVRRKEFANTLSNSNGSQPQPASEPLSEFLPGGYYAEQAQDVIPASGNVPIFKPQASSEPAAKRATSNPPLELPKPPAAPKESEPTQREVERWQIYRYNTPTEVVTAADHDRVVNELQQQLSDEERRGDLHADLNKRTADALGKPFQGDGSSWHDIPEWVAAICSQLAQKDAEIAELKRKLQIADKKNASSLANNLCPDHRDKQSGKPCLACAIERAEAEVERLKLETAYVHDNDTLQVKLTAATARLKELDWYIAETRSFSDGLRELGHEPGGLTIDHIWVCSELRKARERVKELEKFKLPSQTTGDGTQAGTLSVFARAWNGCLQTIRELNPGFEFHESCLDESRKFHFDLGLADRLEKELAAATDRVRELEGLLSRAMCSLRLTEYTSLASEIEKQLSQPETGVGE